MRPETEAAPDRPWVRYAVFAVACLLVHLFLVMGLVPEILQGALVDPDGYMRLVRVRLLQETGAWFDGVVPRANAPFGDELHWTRPFDVLLLAGAAALRPFLGFDAALHWWAVAVTPLLHLGACFALAWAAGALWEDSQLRSLVMPALLAQPVLTGYALAGRADHHVLQILLFVVLVGFALRILVADRPPSRGTLAAAAGTAALGLWVSVEFLLPLAALLAGAGLAWVLRGGRLAGSNAALAGAAAAATTLALALERGPGLPRVEYDRISVVHVSLLLLVWAFWAGMGRAQAMWGSRWGPGRRLLMAGVGGLSVLALQTLLFRRFLLGPQVDVDPQVWAIHHEGITEFQPVLPGTVGWGSFISIMGPLAVWLPLLACVLLRERTDLRWPAWAFLALLTALFVPLGLLQARFATYPAVLFAIGLVEVLRRALERADRIRAPALRTVARVTTSAGLLTGFLFVGGLVRALDTQGAELATDAAPGGCSILRVAGLLNDPAGLGERPRTIAAYIDFGPELLYRTRHSVLGTPYHRNAAGIVDGYRILAATDEATSLSIVQARQVDHLLLCPPADFALWGRGGDWRASLYGRLLEGNVPAWLQAVKLPESSGEFMLFEVVQRAGSGPDPRAEGPPRGGRAARP